VGAFYNGGLWGNSLSIVASSLNFVPGYIKNVDTQHESFSSKTQVIKRLSPKKPLINLYEMNNSYIIMQGGHSGRYLGRGGVSFQNPHACLSAAIVKEKSKEFAAVVC